MTKINKIYNELLKILQLKYKGEECMATKKIRELSFLFGQKMKSIGK